MTEQQPILLEGGIPLRLVRSARARRITLRVPRDGGCAVLTLPAHVPTNEGLAFARSRRDWLMAARARVPARRIVTVGAALPIEGVDHVITPARLRAAQVAQPGVLLVPAHHTPGVAAQAFLKHLAIARLRPACDRHARALGRPFRAIVLRDTSSRWGSCTSDGRLMFSWRLAMAPPAVLDYVAAHEVAHLAHMDHSARFWSACAALFPDHAQQRAWLKSHGAGLMAWRFRD